MSTTEAPLNPVNPEDLVVEQTVTEVPISRRQQLTYAVSFIVVGLVAILAWGIGARSGDAAFSLSDTGDRFQIPTVRFPATPFAIVIGLIIIVLGAAQLGRRFNRRQLVWATATAVVLFVVGFLIWATSGTTNPLSVSGMVVNTVIAAVPLVLGALCGIVCERSGVINIAIEAQMLVGAFLGILVANAADAHYAGILAAMIGGALIGLLLGVFAIKYQVNQVVLGVVLNTLALGLTNLGYHSILSENQDLNTTVTLGAIKIPLLKDIPVLGPALFEGNIIIYLTYLSVVAVQVGLFRTRWGLRTRAVGEHPKAADTVGIKVLRTRYRNVMIGGLLAGLAGAFLTIGNQTGFNANDMAGGRGFIALAAVIFGRWSPKGAVAAALLFGFTDQLQTSLTIITTPITIPSSLLGTAPYIATIIAVAGLVGRVQAPAADGEPYKEG